MSGESGVTAPWEVIAVRHGRLRTTRSNFYLNYSEYGEPDSPLELGYWFWVISNGSRRIVVDTGFSGEGGARRGREVLFDPLQACSELGITRDSGDTEIVITHAHYDHAGNLSGFPSQPVYVHRSEAEFWLGPDARHHQFQSVVDDADLEHLRRVSRTDRVRWIEEAREIAPGVTVVPLPGHTPGQLVVRVETERGTVVLASDACHLDEELERDMPFKHNTDLVGLYRGLRTLREWQGNGDLIIAGHEPAVLDRFPRLDGALREHAVRIA